MKTFRFFLIVVFVTVIFYTFNVGTEYGWSFFSPFMNDIKHDLGWTIQCGFFLFSDI